jgi:hypothetical protein
MTLSRPVFAACTLALAAGLGGLGDAACAADLGLSVGAGAERVAARSIFNALGFDGPLREHPAAAGRSPADLRAALRRLQRETEAGDRVFVFVSGPAARAALRPCELMHSAAALGRQAAQVVMLIDAPVPATCARGPAVPVADGRVVVLSAPRQGTTVITQALRTCLARPGLQANPLASFGDLAACAQRAEAAEGDPRLALLGNPELPLQPRLAILVDPSASVGSESPLVALQQAAARADAHWHVAVADMAADAARLGAGQAPAWSVTSDRDGFVYVVRAAADGSDLNLVYPQRTGESNALHAGQGFVLPRTGLAAPSAAPDRLMVLVSDTALRAGDLLVQLGLPAQPGQR